MLNIITNQLNLLLCLVNDVLDMKMIEQGIYSTKCEEFNPKDTLNFILTIFEPQSQMLKTIISIKTVDSIFMKPLMDRTLGFH